MQITDLHTSILQISMFWEKILSEILWTLQILKYSCQQDIRIWVSLQTTIRVTLGLSRLIKDDNFIYTKNCQSTCNLKSKQVLSWEFSQAFELLKNMSNLALIFKQWKKDQNSFSKGWANYKKGMSYFSQIRQTWRNLINWHMALLSKNHHAFKETSPRKLLKVFHLYKCFCWIFKCFTNCFIRSSKK